MTSAILATIVKALFWGLNQYMKQQKQDEEFYQSYLNFLAMADEKGYIKVTNLIAGEDAYGRLKDRIRERREQESEGP